MSTLAANLTGVAGIDTLASPSRHSGSAFAYRADIDGLRAVAVSAVVLFHALPGALPGGFVGVDIFFVISGFIITRQIVCGLEDGSFHVADFYYRRIQRIFPALLLVLATALLFGVTFLFSVELKAFCKDLIASALFASNIYYWVSGGYFEQNSATRILLHLWSLGVEEQYYLIWPIVISLVWKRRTALLGAVVILLLLSMALNLYESPGHPNATFYLPITRFWELSGGALTYLAFPSPSRRSSDPWGATLLSAMGVICIAGSLLFINEKQIFPGWRAIFPTLGTALIICAGERSWFNGKLLGHPGVVYVGLLSYPLYLWHWPLIVLSRILVPEPHPLVMAGAVALAVLLAVLTYRYVDRPLRFRRVSVDVRRKRAAWLLVGMFVIGGLSFEVLSHDGFPDRFADAGALLHEQQGFSADKECHTVFPAAEFCIAPGQLPGSATIALVGDSHALHLYRGLTSAIEHGQSKVLALGAGNCPPFPGVSVRIGFVLKPCSELFAHALDYILHNDGIKTLVISSYAVSTARGGLDYESGGYIRLIGSGGYDQDSESVYLDGLTRLFDAAVAAGKNVILVYDTPELDFDPLSCLPRPFIPKPPGFTCSVDRRKVDARQGALRARIQGLIASHPGVTGLDPMRVLCDEVRCIAESGSHLLYRDRDHLSDYGSVYLMRRLLKELPEQLN